MEFVKEKKKTKATSQRALCLPGLNNTVTCDSEFAIVDLYYSLRLKKKYKFYFSRSQTILILTKFIQKIINICVSE